MRLASTILLGTTLTVGGATLVHGWLASRALAREIQTTARDHSLSSARALARLLEARVERDLVAVADLAHRLDYEIEDLVPEAINPIIDPWKERFQDMGAVMVSSTTARGLAWSDVPPAQARQKLVSYADRTYFGALMAYRRPLVSTVQMGRVGGVAAIHLLAPIGDIPRGFVGTSMGLDDLQQLARGALAEVDGARAVIWDWNGRVVFDTAAPHAKTLRSVEGPLYAPTTAEAEFRTGPDETNHELMGAVTRARVGPRTWSVLVTRPASVLYARVQKARKRGMAVGAVVLALACLLSLILSRIIARPISNLSAAAEAVEAGDLAAMATLPNKVQGREARELHVALSSMVARLRENQEALDAKVKERTRELAIARDEAMEASRAKTAFIANMSHELRTPMNGVLGSLQILGDSVRGDDLELAEIAHGSARHLQAMLEDLLDFSTMEAGQLSLAMHEIDVRRIFEETVLAHRSKLKDRPVDLRMSFEVDGVSAIGDPDRLAQIWTNLVGNAVKFTESGEIRTHLSTAREGDRLRVTSTVTDTGPGIPPDRLKHIFGAFAKADASMSRRHGGTGLGLAICHGLVKLMEGAFTANSEVGKGTCFAFTLELDAREPRSITRPIPTGAIVVAALPSNDRTHLLSQLALADIETVLAAPESATLPAGQAIVAEDWPHPPPPDALRWGPNGALPRPNSLEELLDALASTEVRQIPEGARVLAVDDNPVNRKVVGRMLQQFGVEVTLAEGGQAALDAVEEKTFDLIFMDCQMPDMDGMEATRRIRARERRDSMPIVALTANTSMNDKKACFDAGMNDHVGKPIRKDVLQTVLEKWIGA